MTTRRLLLFGLLACSLALGAGVWLLWPGPSPISWANYEKIHEGMSLGEVEEILGGSARSDATGPIRVCLTGVFHTPPTKEWVSDEVLVMVHLDSENRVQRHAATAVMRGDSRFFDRVCRWLGL